MTVRALCVPLLLCLGSHAAAADAALQRPVVAVLGMADTTGDASLAHWFTCFESMLRTALKPARAFRTFRGDVDAAQRQVGVKRGAVLRREEARRIGAIIEAQRVVWGELRREGDAWRLTTRVLRVSGGEVSADILAVGEDPWAVRDLQIAGLIQALRVKLTAEEQERVSRRWTASTVALELLARAMHGYLAKQPFPEVERHARAAVEADPRCVMARLGLAAQLGSQGKIEDAGRELDAALALEPEDPEALTQQGVLRIFERRLAEGKECLEKAHELDPDSPEVLFRLGEIALLMGDLERAAVAFEEAQRLDPTSAKIHAKLAEVHARRGQREKALAALSRAEHLTTGEELGDEQNLMMGFRALSETARALEHGERFLTLATKSGMQADRLGAIEELLAALRKRQVATAVEAPLPRTYSASELAAALREKLTAEEVALCTLPLASTPELRSRAQALIAGAATERERAQALFEALRRRSGRTGNQETRTAAQALAALDDPEERFGFQDHAILLTGLAREAGLRAWFVQVDRDPEGRPIHHACCGVVIDGKLYLVEPIAGWFGVPHREFRLLDDLQAAALFACAGQGLPRRQLAVKLWPDSFRTLCNLAMPLASAGRFDEARAAVEAAGKLAPESWQVWYARGFVAWKEGNLDKAAELLRASIAANGSYGHARTGLAGLLASQGELEEALLQCHAALNCDLDEETLEAVRWLIAQIHERRTSL